MVAAYNQTSLPVVMVLLFLMYIPVLGAGVGVQAMAQAGTPDRYRGRVYGALYTTMALLSLAGVGLAGVLGEIFGIVPMLTTAGCITILSGVLALVLIPEPKEHSEPAHEDREAQASA